jgi:hypothetical protein
MFNSTEQFMTIAKANMEMAQRLASLGCDEAERLLKLQMDVIGAALASNSRNLKSLLNNGEANKAFIRWPEVAGASAQSFVDILRVCNEAASKTQAQWLSLVIEGTTAIGRTYLQSLEQMTGKAGSEEEKIRAAA